MEVNYQEAKEYNMCDLHCHVQIEYCSNPNNYNHPDVESLDGIDPRNEDDRKMAHAMLDEYLNVWANRLNDAPNTARSYKEEGFRIYPYSDIH